MNWSQGALRRFVMSQLAVETKFIYSINIQKLKKEKLLPLSGQPIAIADKAGHNFFQAVGYARLSL